VVFSEPVNDFATGDVTISGTAGGSKTAMLSGSGTTYNVAVTGMSSDGTVIASLAAGVAQDAAGNGNTASTSTDNTVTYGISTFTVTASVSGNNGIVYPISQVVNYGASASITITPDDNYYIASIIDNNVLAPISNPFIISNITANHTASVAFSDSITMSTTVVLQGGSRPDPNGWLLPVTVNYFTSGVNVMTGTPSFSFAGTTSKYGGSAIFLTSGVTSGNYDVTIDSSYAA
jgi:hypothetical protein